MTSIFPLAIWQFGSSIMLWWAAAAALPLLIHLWTKRQFRETRWAAMTFLLAAMQKHSRRIRLEQWLLLAIRVAIPLLLALALANPLQLGSAIWRTAWDGAIDNHPGVARAKGATCLSYLITPCLPLGRRARLSARRVPAARWCRDAP